MKDKTIKSVKVIDEYGSNVYLKKRDIQNFLCGYEEKFERLNGWR